MGALPALNVLVTDANLASGRKHSSVGAGLWFIGLLKLGSLSELRCLLFL